MTESVDRWLSIGEICTHLGVSSDTVYKWIDTYGTPAHAWGGCGNSRNMNGIGLSVQPSPQINAGKLAYE